MVKSIMSDYEWSAATHPLAKTFFPKTKEQELVYKGKNIVKCTFCGSLVHKHNCKYFRLSEGKNKRRICYLCSETYNGKYTLYDD